MNKFLKWLIFGVIFAITPLAADYSIQFMHVKEGMGFTWYDVIAKGELLLVCAAIAGAGVGELIGSGKSWLPFKIVTGGFCVILLLLTAELYSSIASDVRAHEVYDVHRLVNQSLLFFIFTLIASAGCILVGEDNG
jgi:hypothetical protein